MRKVRNFISKVRWFVKNISDITPNKVLIQAPFYTTHGKQINYNSDGLAVLNNCDCLTEPRFKMAYEYSLRANDWRSGGFDQRWRFYIVCFFAEQASKLEGDFVECGVYKGGYALAIFKYINFTEKTFYLMDTYEGLDIRYVNEKEQNSGLHEIYKGYGKVYDHILKVFEDKPVKIIKGTVPETLTLCKAEKIAYLSIDMNCVEPEIAAANYFWDKIVPGGVIVLDDYGFSAHIEQKLAFDKFASEKKVSILSLPTGQAIIFKPKE